MQTSDTMESIKSTAPFLSGVVGDSNVDPFTVLDPWSGSSYPCYSQSIGADAADVWSNWKPLKLGGDRGLKLQRVAPRQWAWEGAPFIDIDEDSMVFQRTEAADCAKSN